MKQNIYIKQEKKGKSNIKSLFILSFIMSFFLLLFTLWFLERDKFTSSIRYVFSSKNSVIYNTYSVSFDDSISEEYIESMKNTLEKLEFQGKRRFVFDSKRPDITLSKVEKDDSLKVSGKDLIPVAHIYSLVNDVNESSLEEHNIFVTQEVYKDYLENEYNIQIEVLDNYNELISKLEEDDNNVGLIDFNELDFKVKILNYDGNYYLEDSSGSITIDFYATVKEDIDEHILTVISKNIDLGDTDWEEEKLVKVNMGGVVAITRGLALVMDRLGDYGYPAREIGEFLANADLTHVSNEVSFVPGCKSYSGLSFCSRPEYIEVFELSGVNIVELTGNHNNDYGSQYSAETIQMYVDRGIRYYGGGLNTEDASKILYEEVGDNTIAFVGYNYYDTIYRSLALAGENRSGANSYSDEKMQGDIEEARKNADIVIVTFQFQECWSYPPTDVIYPICYKPLGNPDQKAIFRKGIDFGADIVIGSQAHQPQTYEIYGNGVIFYGTGNLFFDQDIWIGTRQGMVLSHYIYEGKHIQTKITPIYMDKDLIPRIATQEQGDLLMRLLKEARD